MRLYMFPTSRVLGVLALKSHLELECEVQPIDLGRGDQLTPEYLALNPRIGMPKRYRSLVRPTRSPARMAKRAHSEPGSVGRLAVAAKWRDADVPRDIVAFAVGATGFEPATSSSQN